MSKRLSLLCAVLALAVGAPLSAGAAVHHPPKKHGGESGSSGGSSGKGGKHRKNCHGLPCW